MSIVTAFWKVISSAEDTRVRCHGAPHQTIEDLSSNDTSTVVQLVHCTVDDGVSPHNGIISQDGELVRSGDFIELASCPGMVHNTYTEVHQ